MKETKEMKEYIAGIRFDNHGDVVIKLPAHIEDEKEIENALVSTLTLLVEQQTTIFDAFDDMGLVDTNLNLVHWYDNGNPRFGRKVAS